MGSSRLSNNAAVQRASAKDRGALHRLYCIFRKILAGAGGFEPPNGGTKNRCLTTWRRPNVARLLDCGGATRNCARCSWDVPERNPPQPANSLLRPSRALAISRPPVDRSVAQPGRAPRSGRGGRRFKSCHSDQNFPSYFKQLEMWPFGAIFFARQISRQKPPMNQPDPALVRLAQALARQAAREDHALDLAQKKDRPKSEPAGNTGEEDQRNTAPNSKPPCPTLPPAPCRPPPTGSARSV